MGIERSPRVRTNVKRVSDETSTAWTLTQSGKWRRADKGIVTEQKEKQKTVVPWLSGLRGPVRKG